MRMGCKSLVAAYARPMDQHHPSRKNRTGSNISTNGQQRPRQKEKKNGKIHNNTYATIF